jgi:hypothetical protein
VISRRAAAALLSALLAAAPCVAAEPWAAGLPAALDSMASGYWQPSLKAAFGTFTYGYGELASPFSLFVEERLGEAMVSSKSLRLFNKAAASAMDPAFRAVYGDLFKSEGVDALLAGRFFDEGEAVRLHLELTGLSDGVLIGALDLSIPKSAVPAGLAIAPPQAASAAQSSLSALLPKGEGGDSLKVSVSTDRGKGAVYREGEEMVALVTVNEAAYVKVYHIDVDGKTQLIWPNRFGGGSGLVEPGTAIRIPGEGDAFSFRLKAPFGTEFIKVIASSLPFKEMEEDFRSSDEEAGRAITRGLEPADGGSAERAEALASYLILPAK